ncbi:MAG: DoxX family membrane protein [Cyclobacteriaceae bacterium]|jgi:thiosulfate dehydrogenase [quinone] large subunit|nr:DoxX family membrane protein [Cyclobacteriaceae bacterium]
MKTNLYSSGQNTSLVLLRILIGWHFLYEGIIKVYNPAWTAKGYLLSASILKPFFNWLSGDSLIGIVDTLNIVGLLAVGAGLLLGLKIRWACVGGIALLALYYLAHPPFGGLEQGPAEGSYWIVNKNLIEIGALVVLYQFPSYYSFGIEKLFSREKPETVNG